MLAAIALLLALLLSSYIRIGIGYNDDLFAYVRLFGLIKLKIYPSNKSIEAKRLSAKKLYSLKRKENKKVKKQKSNKNKYKNETVRHDELTKDIREIIGELYELLSDIIRRFSYKIKIRIKHLHVTVATDDAAKTALAYCSVCNTIDILVDMLRSAEKINFTFDDLDCICDYTKNKSDIKTDIIVKVRVIHTLSGAVGTLMTYLKKKYNGGI